jgi:hypothetical protein
VEVYLPFTVSGLSDDSVLIVGGINVSLDSADGAHWNSDWRPSGTTIFPEQEQVSLPFTLKKELYERIKVQPVKAVISLALSSYRDEDKHNFVVSDGRFSLPEGGLCMAEASFSRTLNCQFPLRGPSSLLMTGDLSETTCPARRDEIRAPAGTLSREWLRNPDSAPAEFGIDPIVNSAIYFRPSNILDRSWITGVCPGTPVALSHPRWMRRFRITLELSGIRLSDYFSEPGRIPIGLGR